MAPCHVEMTFVTMNTEEAGEMCSSQNSLTFFLNASVWRVSFVLCVVFIGSLVRANAAKDAECALACPLQFLLLIILLTSHLTRLMIASLLNVCTFPF